MAHDAPPEPRNPASVLSGLLTDPDRAKEALQALLDTTPAGIVIVDDGGKVIAANHGLGRLLGLDDAALDRLDFDGLVTQLKRCAEAPDQVDDVMARVRASAGGQKLSSAQLHHCSLQLTRPTPVRVLLDATPVRYGKAAQLGTVWALSDVTEMHRSEERLRAIAEATPIPLIITRVDDGKILYCNDELAAIVGLTAKELIGERSPDFYHDPKDRETVLRLLAEQGSVHSHEVRIRRVDGTLRWTLFSMVTVELSGEQVIIGGLYDITDRKLAEEALERANRELVEAQGRLVQSEKMASLGMLVAGIAHEINTPIGAVSSMHSTLVLGTNKLKKVLEGKLEGGLEAHPDVTKVLAIIEDGNRVIAEGTGRVTNIVRRLKSFARLDEAELKDADLNEGIEDTLTLIHHEMKHGVTVHRDFGDIPPVACFPGRLNQVFLNLLMNAKQAMPEGGEIWVRTWADDDFTYASVRDSGIGISQDDLRRIFDPGFTTKGVGVGTGLGLSICFQIVQEHFGELTAESVQGEGSTFTLQIPHDVEARHEARRAASRAQRPVEDSQ